MPAAGSRRLTACCENLVSGDAYLLGDVLKAMSGATVEITNTDAEGRLTLGDALHYAQEKIQPDELFDFDRLMVVGHVEAVGDERE